MYLNAFIFELRVFHKIGLLDPSRNWIERIEYSWI